MMFVVVVDVGERQKGKRKKEWQKLETNPCCCLVNSRTNSGAPDILCDNTQRKIKSPLELDTLTLGVNTSPVTGRSASFLSAPPTSGLSHIDRVPLRRYLYTCIVRLIEPLHPMILGVLLVVCSAQKNSSLNKHLPYHATS